MNWLARKSELVVLEEYVRIQGEWLKLADEKFKSIEQSQAIPQTIVKELALLKIRLDRLELLTGLRREPEAVHVKGAARIE